MLGSEILDVAIGLILIYLLLSLIASSVREGIEGWMKHRAAYLERGIRELLGDDKGTGLAQDVYKHPLIYSLFTGDYDPEGKNRRWMSPGHRLPSYIPSSNFALALLDTVARGAHVTGVSGDAGPGGPLHIGALRQAAERLPNAHVRRALLAAIDSANGDVARVQSNVEAWFNSSMDRVSGWYKRHTQAVVFAVALVLTVAMNASTFTMAEHLSKVKAVRETLVAQTEGIARVGALPQGEARQHLVSLEHLNLPIGWKGAELRLPWTGREAQWAQLSAAGKTGATMAWGWSYVVWPALGWLLTAFAITLGAPFWFDVLNKVMVIRSTVKPREKSRDEGSEDRQPPGPRGAGRAPEEILGTAPAVPTVPAVPAVAAAAAPVALPAGAGYPASPDPVSVPPHSQPHEWSTGNPEEGLL
jgi:hypothetical protein